MATTNIKEEPNDPVDIKPDIIQDTKSRNQPSPNSDSRQLSPSSPKKFSLSSWHDGNRKSAFLPYKQLHCTVLTNLQRGNTQTETPAPQSVEINYHTKAGQGELTESDIKLEKSVDVADSNGFTALHWAAAYGQYSTVQLLLSQGAEVDRIGSEGETALLLAANGGHHDVVRLLLSEGANVNHVDHVCNTALMYAAKGNHPHCCNELLLKNADVTMVNLNDDTAFNLAVDYNSSLAQAVIENYLLNLMGS